MKNLHLENILLSPHTTEKTALASTLEKRCYVFKVASKATKLQIKQAVELFFSVTVARVNVCNTKPKATKRGLIQGRRKAWKKAYVMLAQNQKIDALESA